MVAVENLTEYLLAQIKSQDVVHVLASEAEYLREVYHKIQFPNSPNL